MKLLHPRILVSTLHFALLIISGFFIPSFHNPEEFIFYVFWYFLFRIAAITSVLLYMITSFKDPGFIPLYSEALTSSEAALAIKDSTHHKQTSSVASHLTAASTTHRVEYKQSPSTNASALNQGNNQNPILSSPKHTDIVNLSQEGSINFECMNSDRLQVSLSEENSIVINIDELPEDEIVVFKNQSHEEIDTGNARDSSIPSIFSRNSDNVDLEDIMVIVQPIGDSDCPSFPSSENEVHEAAMRYCTACHIDQPIRAKHCSQCSRCVATFDHHCPFLGICIGEKNRFLFYWLLFFVASECWIGAITALASINIDAWTNDNIQLIILGIVGIVVGTLITILWTYHSYLASTNLTTWETKSWKKITYLNGLEKSKGSPFSKGFLGNLAYFCKIHKSITNWAFNNRKSNVNL